MAEETIIQEKPTGTQQEASKSLRCRFYPSQVSWLKRDAMPGESWQGRLRRLINAEMERKVAARSKPAPAPGQVQPCLSCGLKRGFHKPECPERVQ